MKLSAYIPKLEYVASSGFMHAIKGRVIDVGLQQIENEFKAERDPDGDAWAARKTDVPWPILYRTGALRGSFSARPSAAGVVFSSSSPYAVYQQRRRQMLPVGSLGTWEQPIQQVFTRTMREALK